jgi:hypothetical protein
LFYACGEKKEEEEEKAPTRIGDDFCSAAIDEKWSIWDKDVKMMESPNASSEVILTIRPGTHVAIWETNETEWKFVATISYGYSEVKHGWIDCSTVMNARSLCVAHERFRKGYKPQPAPKSKPSPPRPSGLTLAKKKQIFYELVALQDRYMKQDPYDTQKQQDAYRVIAKRFGISEKRVREIAVEGVRNGWPKPPLR